MKGLPFFYWLQDQLWKSLACKPGNKPTSSELDPQGPVLWKFVEYVLNIYFFRDLIIEERHMAHKHDFLKIRIQQKHFFSGHDRHLKKWSTKNCWHNSCTSNLIMVLNNLENLRSHNCKSSYQSVLQ